MRQLSQKNRKSLAAGLTSAVAASVAAAVMALSAVPALAGLETPSGGTFTSLAGPTTNPSGVSGGLLSDIDGSTVSIQGSFNNGAGFNVGDSFRLTLTVSSDWYTSDSRVFLTLTALPILGGTGDPRLTSLVFSNGGNSATLNNLGAGLSLTTLGTLLVPGSGLPANYTIAGSTAALTTLTLVFTQFGSGADTSTLQIDRISNPEPGTIALFGVGALGLAGLAWRRRKARIEIVSAS